MVADFSTKDNLKILQITDTHLFGTDSDLFGVNSNKNFDEVIETILKHELMDTDFVLLTGDVSQDDTAESYRYLLKSLASWQKPVFWIAGNHDDEKMMSEVFSEFPLFNQVKSIDLKHWLFLFINTRLEGSASGYIRHDELKALEKVLKVHNKNVALIMHHHPIKTNTPLIDNYILTNSDELWYIISKSKVKLIITGHVHGDYSLSKNGIKIECSPATCFQFKKGTASLQLENCIGYKLHYFVKDNYYTKTIMWKI